MEVSPQKDRVWGGSIVRVGAYLLRYRWLFFGTLVLALLGTACLMAIPLVIRWTFDAFVGSLEVRDLWWGVGLLVACYAGRELFNSLRIHLNNTLEQRVLVDLRGDLHRKLLELPVGFYDRHRSGDIVSRVEGDVENVERALLDGTEQGMVAVLTVLGMMGLLFWREPLLALCVSLPLPVVLWMGWRHAHATRLNWRGVREAAGAMNGLLVEHIQGNRLIHAFGLRAREEARFRERAEEVRRRTLHAMFRWARYWPLSNFVASLGMVSVVGVGGYWAIMNPDSFSTGDLFLFYVSCGLLYEPLSRLHGINHLLAAGKASGDRVFEILDHPVEVTNVPQPVPMPQGELEVRFERVSFRYAERASVLQDFDLCLKAGSVTALVGHTGAGKTTVANLLLRHYDVTGGAVRINGVDVREIELGALRQGVGFVAQEPFLFDGTVEDNLLLARPGAPEAALIAALEGASAWEFVERLPEGLKTNIGERGVRLSQGEKQRLTLARVFLKNPRLVILDEATASVDTLTERHIQQALERLMASRTVLVIAHRLSTVRRADCIVVMAHGRIVEQGTHEALVAQGGHYAGLWRYQVDLIPEGPAG